MNGGIIGVVGLQGVGKSGALQTIYRTRIEQMDRQWASSSEKGPVPRHAYHIVLFKWRRESELFRSLLNGSHEAHESFLSESIETLKQRGLIAGHLPQNLRVPLSTNSPRGVPTLSLRAELRESQPLH